MTKKHIILCLFIGLSLCGVKLELTFQAIADLKRYQRQTDDKSVYTKVTCILMSSKCFSAEDISQSLGIDVSTVYRYVKSYSSIGLSDFLATDYKGYWGRLSSAEISVLRGELKSKVTPLKKQYEIELFLQIFPNKLK